MSSLAGFGLAASLERIKAQLLGVSPSCRVFSYLDDVMVVIPAAFAETALNAVVTELEGVGLTVNADKTAVWTKDPLTPLPPRLQRLRVTQCEVLGATAPWLDTDGDFSRVRIHNFTDSSKVLDSARTFVAKVAELRKAGLGAKVAFLVLQAFSHGHVTHVLRANYECSGWAKQFDDVLVGGVESLVGSSLREDQREQLFLRLADGGLGFASAAQATEAAYLRSWALTLKEVVACVGVNSWEGFRDKCGPLAQDFSASRRAVDPRFWWDATAS